MAAAERKKTGNDIDWHEMIPDGYTTYQIKDGRVFFQTMTLGQKTIEEILANMPEKTEVAAEDLKKILAVGGKYKEYVLKEELAEKLQHLEETQKNNPIAQFSRKVENLWKMWVTGINPQYFAKFNIRNITGDLERVIMNQPGVMKHLGKSLADLRAASTNKTFSAELAEFRQMGGFETLQIPQEIGHINDLFPELQTNKKIPNPVKFVAKNYVSGIQAFNNVREAVLRYAAYLYYKDALGKGQVSYGAAKPNMIRGLKTNNAKAFELANYLVGAYNRVSETGRWIARHMIPFYRFMEQNFKAYVQTLQNTVDQSVVREQLGAKGKKTYRFNQTMQTGQNVSRTLALMSAFSLIAALWNQLKYPDEVKDLPDYVKERAYVIFGRDKDGKVMYFDRIGTLGDFLDWFPSVQKIAEFSKGKITAGQLTEDSLKRPAQKVLNSITPLFKTPAELGLGKTIFPDIANPTTIRDKKLYAFQQAGMEAAGRRMLGLPIQNKGNMAEVGKQLIMYKSDPEATAYSKILDLKRKFEKNTLNKYPTEAFSDSPKSNALYNYKLALKYGDSEAAQKFLKQYTANGGTGDGLQRSLGSLHPLYGLNEVNRQRFILSLDAEDRETLKKANAYYTELMKARSKK
jgi:hypothetical protein